MHACNQVLESGLLEEININSEERNKIKDCLRTFQSYRDTIGYGSGPKASTHPDKSSSFLAGTSPAGEDLFHLCRELIYSQCYDSAWHRAIEDRKYAKDVIRDSPIKELFEAIKVKAAHACFRHS